MTTAKQDEPKKAKSSDEPDYATEIAKIGAAVKSLVADGMGSGDATKIAMHVWSACCCK